jgi:DNA-binding CsgD family transcriptional regulator
MPTPTALRVPDVCAAYRLVGECRDVCADPDEWRCHALAGLARLIGGFAATGGEGLWSRPTKPLRALTGTVVGFEGASRDRFLTYMREQGVLADPIFQHLQHVTGDIVTCTRRQVVPDREWYHSASFNEYRKVAGADHQLTSIYQVTTRGAISSLCVHRAVGERDFSPRERAIASFFHVELGRLIGGALISALEPSVSALPPRLRQTLMCLMEGDSEKQVAARLGLSAWTVHQYVTMLYRRLGVRTRGELMAHVSKRLGRWGPVVATDVEV